MPRSPSSAAAGGLPQDPTHICPVAALAREVKTQNDAWYKPDGPIIDARREVIEEEATRLLTQSGLGAILQVQMIMNNAETLASWVPENSRGAGLCADWVAGIKRMSYSLVAFIEATTGTKAEDASCRYYMPREQNPHRARALKLKGTH